MRWPALLIVVFGACSRHPPVDRATPADASFGPATQVDAASATNGAAASVDAGSPAIGPAGGVVSGGDARLIVPPGAFHGEHVVRVARATEAELASFPRGTAIGFVFDPPERRFRVPATIELPHPDPSGEVMCQNASGERRHETFDASHASGPFRLHVVELPVRCAVYTTGHTLAREAAREKEAAIVARHNKAFRWEIKGQVCDPHALVRSNAGKDLREPPGINGCPPGMAPIAGGGPLCIDRWEAHVVEVLNDGSEHTWSPFFNPGALRVRAKSAPGAIPQGYISQLQSGAACKEAGKRLCRDDEWVAACRGAKRTQFPYGNEEKRGICNDHRAQHPAMQYLESRDLSCFSKLEHPCISQVPDSLLPTGTKAQCATPEGVYDIVGNLHEWTADPKGHFRGGYYVDTWLNGHGCDYVTTRHEPAYWDYSTGFRCCADREN